MKKSLASLKLWNVQRRSKETVRRQLVRVQEMGKMQGGRGTWTVNYTGTQNFITTLSYRSLKNFGLNVSFFIIIGDM